MNRAAAVLFAALMLVPALAGGATAQRGPPLVPDVLPDAIQNPLNAAWHTVDNRFRSLASVTPTIFREDFEGPATLAERGWREEILGTGVHAEPIWNVAVANATRRDRGEVTHIVPAGEGAATVATEARQYVPFRESRLVSPPIDLRHVLGRSFDADPVEDDPRFHEGQPSLFDVRKRIDGALQERLGGRGGDAEVVLNDVRSDMDERGLTSEREGVGLVNLTFWHTWNLANGDVAWIDVRTREGEGWSDWQPLQGDLVYEMDVDYASLIRHSTYCDLARSGRGYGVTTATGTASAVTQYCDPRVPFDVESLLLDHGAGVFDQDGDGRPDPNLAGALWMFADMMLPVDDGRIGPQSDGGIPFLPPSTTSVSQLYAFLEGGNREDIPAYYNGVETDPATGESRRVWEGTSGDPRSDGFVVRKSHFTLNRFIGKEVQVAFHFRSGPAAAGEFGWYVDEVQVTAASPSHDPAINAALAPEFGDVLAADTRLRPLVLLANNGRFNVSHANVSFQLMDARGTVILQERVHVPNLGPVAKIRLGTAGLTPPLAPGDYTLVANVTAPPAVGALLQPDAARGNNEVRVAFSVKSVLDARVTVRVPTDQVVTEVDAAKKDLLVLVENRGNVNTTGVLNVTAQPLNATTGEPEGPAEVVFSETLLPVDFPYGKLLTVTGAEDSTAERTFSWTPATAGAYLLQARFTDASGVVFDSHPAPVYVRVIPDPFLGPETFPVTSRPPSWDLAPQHVRQHGFRSWGWSGAGLGTSQQSGVTACGTGDKVSGKPGSPSALNTYDRYPPQCPVQHAPGGLGAAEGEYLMVGTHQDYLLHNSAIPFHGTNIFDEGILERVLVLGAGDLQPAQRLFVSFRHVGEFLWNSTSDTSSWAEPNNFRGQFRVLEDDGAADAPNPPAGSPKEVPRNKDRLLVSVNFTKPVEWERAVVDITPAVADLTSGTRTLKLQWVIQSTPANVVPTWRTGTYSYGQATPNRPQPADAGGPLAECGVGPNVVQSVSGVTSTCSLNSPTRRWGVDSFNVYWSSPTRDPRPASSAQLVWKNGLENRGSLADPAPFDDFTGCRENLYRAKTPNEIPAEGYHLGDWEQASDPQNTQNLVFEKCRQWQRERMHAFPTMWYTIRVEGRGAPVNGDDDRSAWLQWGSPSGAPEGHPDQSASGIYHVAATPRFSLAAAQQPVLAFDHWYDFLRGVNRFEDPYDASRKTSYAREGGNVWISGYDANGRRVVHELLYPDASSPSQYTAPIYPSEYRANGAAFEQPGLRGVPEWSTNYSKHIRQNAVFHNTSGGGLVAEWVHARFDLSRYASEEMRDLMWSVEFHGMQARLGDGRSQPSKGWRIDNLVVRESRLANDVALAEIESPASVVGPGVTQPVVLRVRNDGLFPQRGVGVEYRVLRGGDVVWGPHQARIPYGSEADALPGLLAKDKPDKNATFPFNVSWTPEEEGTYVLEARVNLSASTVPYLDENPANDLVTRLIAVKEIHDVAVLGPSVMADPEVVSPYLGPVNEARSLTVVVENTGTVPERFLGTQEHLFRVVVDIVGEDGRSVLPSPLAQNLRELLPGQRSVVEFPNAWVPTSSGVYDIVIRLEYPSEDDDGDPSTPLVSKDHLGDNLRIVKHLVFDRLVPAAEANITMELQPDDVELWGHNASRYATSDGWSFPAGLEYGPNLDSALTLERVLNLRSVRSAFVRLNQSFDFERSYDGGRLEASTDGGRTWVALPPIETGGWEAMSTASPLFAEANGTVYAFTGQAAGTWEFNLAEIPGFHKPAVLLDDDFERKGLPQLRADLSDGPQAEAGPTAAGFRASVVPEMAGRPKNTLAARVTANAPFTEVEASVDGSRWFKLQKQGDVYVRSFVTDLDTKEERDAYKALPVLLGEGSTVRFRVQPAADPKGHWFSPVFVVHPGVGHELAEAPREIGWRLAPGQKILWSNKHALLCAEHANGLQTGTAPSGTFEVSTSAAPCMGKVPSAANWWGTLSPVDGPVVTAKYVESTVDLTALEPGAAGVLTVALRDAASLPTSYRRVQGTLQSFDHDVRVVFTAGDTRIEKSARAMGDPTDRYWNWTDRKIVLQGQEWASLAGKVVEFRVEHVVAAASSGELGNPTHGDPKQPDLRFTDEFSANFGYGLARLAVTASAPGLGTATVAELDPTALGSAADLAAAGWRMGAVSHHYYVDDGESEPLETTARVAYCCFPDLWEVTREPFARGFWRPASAVEWERPRNNAPEPVYGFKGTVNHFWEANASRRITENPGGASRLVMPLDLKPAVGETMLTFNTQYNFHRAKLGEASGGTGGGRVEVSLDGGVSWQPIFPIDPQTSPYPAPAHPGQINPDGTPEVIDRPGRYEKLFWTDSIGFGYANHFADDAVTTLGRPHEFGSFGDDVRGQYTYAFTGSSPEASNSKGGRAIQYPTPPGSTVGTTAIHYVKPWQRVAFDLTPFAGRDVLLAFHASFPTHTVAAGIDLEDSGQLSARGQFVNFWRIDDLKVTTEVFQGGDVRLRLRAATDGTVGGSGWDVRDFQVISQKHLLNAGARVVSPTSDEALRLGDNPVVVEVTNKGMTRLEDVVLGVWVNGTGPNAPADRRWSGLLNEFVGCPGEAVPADGDLPAETSVRLCGHVSDGAFILQGAEATEYTIEVAVAHDDFGDELLVGDNFDTRELDADQVVVESQVVAEGLTLRPSIILRGAERDVEVRATLRLRGFERVDLKDAVLRLYGDSERPVELHLDQARSIDTKFTVPGETRTVAWTLPASLFDEMRDALYQAEVTAVTAHPAKKLEDRSTAPFLLTTSLKPDAGLLFFDDATESTGPESVEAPGASTGHTINTLDHRKQCKDDPRKDPRTWCMYQTPANGTLKATPDSNPHAGMDPASWRRRVVDNSSMNAFDHPSVRQRGLVFHLDGHKNSPAATAPAPSGNNGGEIPRYEDKAIHLETPTIDVSRMVGTDGIPRIGLSFLQRYDFGQQGVVGQMYVAVWKPGPLGAGGQAVVLDPNTGYEWIAVGPPIEGVSKGYGDYEFEPWSADVAGAILANNTLKNLDMSYIRLRWTLYVPNQASFSAWQVDDVRVGPLVATLGPDQTFPLNDDTDKTYQYVLRNVGAFSDTYNVTLRQPNGARIELPEGWNVTILDEDGAILDQMGREPLPTDRCTRVTGERREFVELHAGDARTIRVKLCIPVSSGTPGRTGYAPIQVTAFSQTLAGLVSGSSLDLDYTYLNRPNLRLFTVRPGADLPVDQPRQVTVEVQNTGTVSACEAVVRLVDAVRGEAPQTIYGSNGQEPTLGACRKRPDGVLEGGLPPGEARQFRFVWTPRTVGWHNLTATVDPEERISELVEDDNVAVLPVEVRLPSFPDVVARVTVSDAEPNIGDAVSVSLALRNVGGISAQSVNVTMKIGVTDLLGRGAVNEGLVPRIEPGQTVWINKTWRAVFPGKVLLYVNALPRDGVLEKVETQGNNLVVVPLYVRSQGLDVAAKVVGVSASPGDAREVGFVIFNNGDTPDAYRVEVDAPKGVRASVFRDGSKVETLALANRTSVNLTVLLDLPPKLAAGNYTLGLRAVSLNTTQTRVAQFTLDVKPFYGLFLEAAQAASRPGRVVVPVGVTNLGNARDSIRVEALDAPPGWRPVVTDAHVDPYGRAVVDLVMEVPTTTPRGIYEVLARVVDAAGVESRAVVGVQIQDYQVAVPTLALETTVVRPESLVPTRLVLRNEGNVRAETRLETSAPAGWVVELGRPAAVLDPGESLELPVTVLVPPSAPFGQGEVKITSRSGDVVRTAVLAVTVAESDLHVLELDYAPRVGIQQGDVVNFTAIVRNDGKVAAEGAGLAFYVDDVLAGYEKVPRLEAGGERTVSFRWTAVGGDHVVLAILDPGDEVREVDEANNARLEIVRVGRTVGVLTAAQQAVPGPGLALLAAAAVVAALAAGRRRRDSN